MTLHDALSGARELLLQARELSRVQQSAATYKLADGQFTPLVHATETAAMVQLLCLQLDHLLEPSHGRIADHR
jgi:hypothetical protein